MFLLFVGFFKKQNRNTIRVSDSLDPDRPDILPGLIWVHIVCNGYQLTTLTNKALKYSITCVKRTLKNRQNEDLTCYDK